MKSLFDMAGISKEVLEDEEMRSKIYDVIEKQGGMDAVKQQVNRRAPPQAPPPPSRAGMLITPHSLYRHQSCLACDPR